MTIQNHRLYILLLATIVVVVFTYLLVSGMSFYNTPLDQRFFHGDYQNLKPSGLTGHGLGIIGTLLILTGVFGYMVRKRNKHLRKVGILKHWLELHIFLCTLGPVMVLFHTSFKIGGIVSISFWSMVAVFLSGILGRFIYLQIPRSIEGRELSLSEVRAMKSELGETLVSSRELDKKSVQQIIDSARSNLLIEESNPMKRFIKRRQSDRKALAAIRKSLKDYRLSRKKRKPILKLVKKELALGGRIGRLDTMKRLFRYWHVAHLPFALVMISIMIIHVVITITLGYRWVF